MLGGLAPALRVRLGGLILVLLPRFFGRARARGGGLGGVSHLYGRYLGWPHGAAHALEQELGSQRYGEGCDALAQPLGAVTIAVTPRRARDASPLTKPLGRRSRDGGGGGGGDGSSSAERG